MNPNVFIRRNDRITLQKVLQKDRLYAQNTSTVAYHNQHKKEKKLSCRRDRFVLRIISLSH